jgi:hypothetical protein
VLGLIFWGSGFFGLLKFNIGLKAFKSWTLKTGLKICKNLQKLQKIYFICLLKNFSGPKDLKGSIIGPIGLCPIFRPFGLGLGVLFSKKPEPDPPLPARGEFVV